MNFIIARFSKDNFWNLGVFTGILLAVFVAEQNGSIVLLISAFTLVPYLLTRPNKVRYLEDGTCVNSEGQELSNRASCVIFGIIVLSIIFNAFGRATGLLDFLCDVPEVMRAPTFVGCIIFWPFVYVIIKNYPISILFNVDSWVENRSGSVTGFIRHSSSDPTLHHLPIGNSYTYSSSKNDLITSPVYSHLPQNVYHRNHSNRY